MRRPIILFAAAFLLAGCAGAEPVAVAPSSSPAPAAGGSWMDGFCGSLIDFAKIGDFKMPDVEQGDVASARKAMDEAFGVFAPGFDNAVTGLKGLGQAPSAEAENARKSIVDALTPIRDQVVAAKTKLDAAPKDDKTAAAEAAVSFRRIGSDINDMPDPFQQLETNASLKALAEQAPNCKKLPS
ncbi:hypothetical protein GCM10027598_32560 [Amycolatopsis oliviviridis]|uniref:Small secreted protein n=1 Tax=Amycolatopsis oliviviridis TaxID=1471590 RepID=A0ABQ3LT24_9PSEU|nr:hypothetical protein [Amycolatopsis oliviviridis]GHH23965.1 hypothetical protein GCM10017790_47600 [Amycolatopsis oliviviridis]